MSPDDGSLIVYVRQFESSEETTRDARRKSEKCRDYFDDKQLTSAEEKELTGRGQPSVVFNEIKPKVKTMLGLEKQTRKDPKAFPRNPDDEEAARAATDSIRYVCDDSDWDTKRSQASKNLAIEGTGAVFVGVRQTRGAIDPEVRHVPWDRFYYDPHSAADDFGDAEYMGEVIWMDLDKAIARFPDAKDILTATWQQASTDETYDDRPKFNLWADHKRRRVRICEHYHKDAEGWRFCMFTKGGYVVDPQVSPYMGDDGEPECPIKAISLYVDRENQRYGEVQAMLSPQDEINKRRSKSLWHVSTRQLRVSPAVSINPDEVRKELSRPDGVFIGEAGDVEVFGTNDMAMGNLNLMQDAREHIHRTGANNALAGKDTSNQSGRAIIAQQNGGMVETADYLDAVRRLSMAVYRSIWSRVQQFWKAERWIRVTDNELNVRFVGLNRPVTALQAAARQMGVDKDNLEQADPQAVQQLQLMAMDPRSQQVVAIENNVTELDVDIIVDEGFDTPTIQAEQFELMMKMAGSGVPLPPDVLIEASSLRNKDRLLEKMREPNPQAEAQAQLGMAGAQAEVEKTQSETAKNMADAEAKQAGTMKAGAEMGLAA